MKYLCLGALYSFHMLPLHVICSIGLRRMKRMHVPGVCNLVPFIVHILTCPGGGEGHVARREGGEGRGLENFSEGGKDLVYYTTFLSAPLWCV